MPAQVIAEDSPVVHARTLELAVDLEFDVIVVPVGYSRMGSTPDGKDGLKWKSKYASISANGVGMGFIFDGFNEKGPCYRSVLLPYYRWIYAL